MYFFFYRLRFTCNPTKAGQTSVCMTTSNTSLTSMIHLLNTKPPFNLHLSDTKDQSLLSANLKD